MPLTRYQIRNEYSLADPELYKAADKDDPEALLEGVAMAGLVGVLRQLGDLAEFAAEIFHDLHEEVIATAARGHGLMVRVQQLEAEVPSIEKAILSQTNHSSFFSSAGVDWHPNLRMEQNLITRGDLPRCVMDSYEECRGPPRLFLLDKFDVAGAGACLKRYTDPSFFKVESAPSEIPSVEIQREKKIRKVKKKGSRWRNGETPETVPTSHAKLHQLFLEEKIEKGQSDPARLVKLKKRQLNASPFDSRSGKSYMEKFLETTPEHNVVHEISVTPLLLKLTPDNSSESGLEIHDISTVSPVKKSSQGKETSCTSPDAHEEVLKPSTDDLYGEVIDRQIVEVPEPSADGERDERPYILHEAISEKEIVVGEEDKPEGSMDGDNSDDMPSEVDNYMDALATMESEMDIDNECGPKIDSGFSNIEKHRGDSYGNGEQLEFRPCSSDSQSTGNFSASDDGNSSFKKGRSSFSYSDTLSNLAENTQSEGEGSAKAFPSEASVPEIKETPSNQLPAYARFLQTSHDLMMPTDMCTGEDNICDCGEASDKYADIDSNAPPLPLEPAEISLQQKLDETLSETMKPGSELLDIDERHTNFADPSAVAFDMSSQTRDITFSTVCAESHPLDMLGGGDPNVSSDVLLHLSNDSKMVPEKKSSDDFSDEVLPKDFREEDCPENMVNIKIGSPKSISSPRIEQYACSALPEVEAHSGFTLLSDSSDVGKLDDVVSKVDETLLGTGVYLKSSTSVMDTSQSCSFKEQQASDVVDNDTAEKPVLYSEEANLADTSGSADIEKIGVSTCKFEAMEGDAAPPELPSNCTDSLVLEDHVRLDDVVAESVQSENMTPSTTATDDVLAEACADDHIDNVVCPPQDIIYSSSNDLVNLQEFPSSTEDPDDKLESNELVSSECLRGSEAEKEMTQLEVAPKDFESASSKLVSYEEFNLEMVNGVHNLSLADTIQNSFPAGGITVPPASSELSNQEMESKHPLESCLLEDGEDGRSSPAGHLSDPDTFLEQSLELQADRLDVESMTGEASSDSLTHLSEQVQSSNNGSQERLFNDESCQEHLSSQPLPSECVRQSTGQEINNAKQEMGPPGSVLPSFGLLHEATQVHLEEMPPLPPLPPMQWRLVKIQQAPLVSQRDFTDHIQQSFPSMSPFGDHEEAQSGFPSQQIGFLPSFNPFLPISAVEVEKFQHVCKQEEGNAMQPALSSLQLPCVANDANSRKNNLAVEETQSLNPFLTLSASPNDEPEHGFLASEHEVVQSSSNPFLSLPAVEAATSRPDPVSSLEKLVHPLNQLLSEPGLKDKTHQQTLENSEGEHVNPSDTSVLLPRKVEEQPQQGLPSSEGETLQLTENSEGEHVNPSDMSVLPSRNVEEQPHDDFLSSEGKALQHTPENSEGEHVNPFDTSVLPPRKVEEQPQQGLPCSEGETLQLTAENSEGEHVNPSCSPSDMSVLPPRKVEEQPQHDFPSSEDKALQHTQENSEGEHVNPFDTSVLPPRKVEEQPQHGLPSSERESAWPSNPFALLPNFEVGKENEGLIVKLPRPRNPLIDAVAAHDKSKLRKVTERIRPQVGPKVDERDSLLEQIRTKSFNLKPAVVSRPSIQGPKTNLRVAAILEKANAIRQATAGSDEDDDDDSWSDS